MQRGRLVILLMLTIGILAGAVSVWVHYQAGRRALKYWGPVGALLLRDADRVRLTRLQPATDAADVKFKGIANRDWEAQQTVDVSHRAGVLHIREALLHDSTFDWKAGPGNCQPESLFLFVFQSGEDELEVILDTECGWLRSKKGSSSPEISIAPSAAFFDRWVKQQLPATDR